MKAHTTCNLCSPNSLDNLNKEIIVSPEIENFKWFSLTELSIELHQDHGSPGSGAKNDVILDNGHKLRSLALDDDADTLQHELNYSELEDSGDEQAPRTSPENSQKRRKLRIVMDFDDDE